MCWVKRANLRVHQSHSMMRCTIDVAPDFRPRLLRWRAQVAPSAVPQALATDVSLLMPRHKAVTLRFKDEADAAAWVGVLNVRLLSYRAMGEVAHTEDVVIDVVCRAFTSLP